MDATLTDFAGEINAFMDKIQSLVRSGYHFDHQTHYCDRNDKEGLTVRMAGANNKELEFLSLSSHILPLIATLDCNLAGQFGLLFVSTYTNGSRFRTAFVPIK